jgi:hypothetical protein
LSAQADRESAARFSITEPLSSSLSFLSPAGNTAGVSFCPRAAVKPDVEVNVSVAESVYIVK